MNETLKNGITTLLMLSLTLLLIAPVTAISLTPASTPGTSAQTIANGDSVTLHGYATGHPRVGLQVWVISKNYLKVSTIQVNDDNTFDFELRSPDTLNLASGQYYVVVQHPMGNGQFDVYYDSGSGTIINRQLGGGSKIFQMSGSGSLQGPDSAQALVNAISSQNLDDIFTTYTFTVSPPSAFIRPIGDHAVGDRFTISGSTNLAVGDNLMVEITSSSFKPTQKNAPAGFSGASGMVTVLPGTGGFNHWSFDVDASEFTPDEYIVKVSGITVEVTGSTTFNILERQTATQATTRVTTAETTAFPTPTLPPKPAATTPAKSPLALWIAAAGLAVVIVGKRR
jgi:hypothetical protein